MTTAEIHDAIGAKLLALSGVVVAYADGSTGTANVLPWTDVVSKMPAVVVTPGETALVKPGLSYERYNRRWAADFYVSAVEPGAAMQWLNQLHDSLRAAARENYSLDRAVSFLKFTGLGAVTRRQEGQGDEAVRYLVLPTRWETWERNAATYTPTS